MQCEAGYFHMRAHSLGSVPAVSSYRSSNSYAPEVHLSHDASRGAVRSSMYYPSPIPSFSNAYSSTSPALPSSSTQYSLNGISETPPHAWIPFAQPIDPRRILKSSDAYPILSGNLEERLLQLAERSRRLGVHRFSRSRQSLVLNTPPTVISASDGAFFVGNSKQPMLNTIHPATSRATFRE